MATLKTTQAFDFPISEDASFQIPSLVKRYNDFADGQKSNHTGWFLISMLLHSTIFVPLSFLLVYSLDGIILPFLVTSMGLFFANIIANMGGASTRFTIFILWLSVIAHVLMAAFTLLYYFY